MVLSCISLNFRFITLAPYRKFHQRELRLHHHVKCYRLRTWSRLQTQLSKAPGQTLSPILQAKKTDIDDTISVISNLL